jgi:glycosyltransferase involved in cell wall biosynthesis
VRNSGIGTYYSLAAPLLVQAGWRVHILYLGYSDSSKGLAQAPAALRRQGVSFSLLSDFDTPEIMRVRTIHGCHGEHEPGKGIRILRALEELHRVYQFDLIEFPDWLAFGFRTIQMRRTAGCLGSARLCVKLHAFSAWQRDGNHVWPQGPGELSLDYRERYAFENADVQMAPSRYMLDYVERQGWKTCGPVVAYPFPDPVVSAPRTDDHVPTEVVFFGRLEIRKGLELFLDAVSDLPAGVDVTFLGRDTVLPSGQLATEYIQHRLRSRSFKIHTEFMREQALKYLAAENRLSVIASLSERFGFTVAECAVNGLPFIAARAGGTTEVIPEPEIQQGLFFEPTSRDLRRCLTEYFKMAPARRRALRLQSRKSVEPTIRNAQMIAAYDGILERYRQESSPRLMLGPRAISRGPLELTGALAECEEEEIDPRFEVSDQRKICQLADDSDRVPSIVAMPGPLVTVAVAHYNLGPYLGATLQAIATQTYPHIEVIVIDDGSTCPVSTRVLNQLQEDYPRIRFIGQKNMGPGAARNRALAEARGEFFIPVDADNLPIPTMVERFVEGMLRNPDLSVLTCFLTAFNDEEGTGADVAEFVYMPAGGPFVVSCFENVYGDTNAIFRTQHFREAGGFETDPDTFIEDWETFVKLVAAGRKLDVIPDVLFNYRLRRDSRSLVMSRGRSDMYPFVQRMIRRRFAPLQELQPLDTEMLWLGMAAFGAHKFHRPGSSSSQPASDGWQVPSMALRYRVADRVNSYLKWIAPIHRICRSMLVLALRASGRRRPAPPAAASTAENAGAPTRGIRPFGLPWPKFRGRHAAKAA